MPPWLEFIQDWEGLIGVVLGAIIAGGGSVIGRWVTTQRTKAAIRDELRANRYQIAQKRDILRQMLDALSGGGILPAQSVPISTAVFDSYFPSVVTSFSPIERDNLHLIYNRLKIYDQFLNEYEQNIKDDLSNDKVENVNDTYSMHIRSIDQGYAITAALIANFLADKPEDVFNQKHATPPTKFTH